MQLASTIEVSDLLTLAFSVKQNLTQPASFFIEEDGSKITVTGRLNLSHEDIVTRTTALCIFIIPVDWKVRQPSVWSREPWRKLPLPGGICNAEWHVLGNGSLCYELPHKWIDEIANAEKTGGSTVAVELASDWVLNSSRWLLYRHLEAFRHNLPRWQNAYWPAWGHYQYGPHEYFQMKKREARAARRLKNTVLVNG